MNSWIEEENRLKKTFKFDNFLDATRWMFDVSEGIEEINHHPTWSNTYNRVKVELTTHDAGNKVTEKDHQLAGLLDQSFQDFK